MQWAINTHLARTPYMVLPRVALEIMPDEWRARFEQLMTEMRDTGISTPQYHVLRDDGHGERYTRCTVVNEMTGFLRITGGEPDPWANYRYMTEDEFAKICPTWEKPS